MVVDGSWMYFTTFLNDSYPFFGSSNGAPQKKSGLPTLWQGRRETHQLPVLLWPCNLEVGKTKKKTSKFSSRFLGLMNFLIMIF